VVDTVAQLYGRLNGDAWRIRNPFREDILQANALLHNGAATVDEMAECLSLWCLQKQPCQFGRAAAKQGRIHFCVLTHDSLANWRDEDIAAKISDEKRLWKQRAAFDNLRAAHSFVVVAASSTVALAAPDQQLRAFSNRILELIGWQHVEPRKCTANAVTSDYLFLRNPNDSAFYGFQFNADFFACAADGRWWQDHRFPGGIAFTANSTGHMIRFREWYDGKTQSEAWALKQAMLTVSNAAPTKPAHPQSPAEQGCATWLRPLDSTGKPLLAEVACPLDRVPPVLAGKDWTRYEGVLHTDHAVREEFFVDREIAPTASRPYLMDLTYLYRDDEREFEEFTRGRRFSDDEVYAEIGHPRDWTHRARVAVRPRSEDEAAIVAEQLLACRDWRPQEWYAADAES
jgi:hypothetical protein